MARWACPTTARRTRALAAAGATVVLMTSGSVRAELTPGEPGEAGVSTGAVELEPGATVVEVDEGDIIVDLGRESGLTAGDMVELWRPLELRHPVTRKTLTDRFRIGTLELVQVRPELSLARPKGELDREPLPGDVIVFRKRPPPASTGGVEAQVGSAEPPAADATASMAPDVAYAVEMVAALRGADLAARVRAYDEFVRRFPESSLAPTLHEEAAALRNLYVLGSKLAAKGGDETRAGPRVVAFNPPAEVMQGKPLTLAIELDELASGAVIHYRRPSSPAFTTIPMRQAGAGYYAATIPKTDLVAPTLEYFIEATGPEGRPVAVASDERTPDRIDVLAPPGEHAGREILATVSVLTDYADYNRVRGNDRVWQTEGAFGMRFSDTGLRALRSGFGVYRGVGGSVEELDEQGLAPREIGLTYGYVETEAAPLEALGFIGRGIVGLGDDGVSGGGQLLVRIGHDQRTNLLLGAELLGTVGLRSIAQLELNSFERFPIVLRTEVTNQPAGASPSTEDGDGVSQGGGELGARGIAQLGFRIVPELVVAARGSFQGRTIKHAGPGAGGAVSYSW